MKEERQQGEGEGREGGREGRREGGREGEREKGRERRRVEGRRPVLGRLTLGVRTKPTEGARLGARLGTRANAPPPLGTRVKPPVPPPSPPSPAASSAGAESAPAAGGGEEDSGAGVGGRSGFGRSHLCVCCAVSCLPLVRACVRVPGGGGLACTPPQSSRVMSACVCMHTHTCAHMHTCARTHMHTHNIDVLGGAGGGVHVVVAP